MMIDKAIKNIKKKILQYFGENTYSKNIRKKKNTLQGFGGNTYSKNSSIKFYFFCISYIQKG